MVIIALFDVAVVAVVVVDSRSVAKNAKRMVRKTEKLRHLHEKGH